MLCDEPTGALYYNTGKNILKVLQDTNENLGMIVIIITHNMAIAPMRDKVITVKNGKVHNILKNEKYISIERIEW